MDLVQPRAERQPFSRFDGDWFVGLVAWSDAGHGLECGQAFDGLGMLIEQAAVLGRERFAPPAARHDAEASFPTIVAAGVGGSPTPVPLIETWNTKGLPLQQAFGMTETAPLVGSIRRLMSRSSVVLPEPEAPTSTVKLRGAISSEI